jgi:RNA-directed DNA polymerase
MQCVARRIVDRNVLHLIKLWLKAPVEERDRDGKRRMSGGRKSKCGVPQGGVISPLLANLYINRFLKYWRIAERGRAFRAYVISYADDFVILSRGQAGKALEWTRQVMERLKLKLHEEKTVIRDAEREHFDFLGYTFGSIWFRKEGTKYMSASASKRSVLRLKRKLRYTLRPSEKGSWPEVRDRLNTILRGWCTYFSYGTTQIAYRAVERNVYEGVRLFLTRRHKVQARGIRRFPSERVFGELGVMLPRPMK